MANHPVPAWTGNLCSQRLSEAQLPQIGKVGRRGEDHIPSQRVDPPLLSRQGRCHLRPTRGGSNAGHNLQHHSANDGEGEGRSSKGQ